MPLPESLIEAARQGDLVPFVGSGLSSAGGVRSWERVVQALQARGLGHTGASGHFTLTETPDAVRRYLPSAEYRRILREAFGDHFRPTVQHELLTRLPVRTILTTNFDSLVEHAFGQRVNVIATNAEARQWRESDAVQVVKLHGTFERPETMVFGDQAYGELYQSAGMLMSLVRTIMSTRPVLFIGFGMRDPFVKGLLGPTRGPERDHYILVREDDVRAAYYEDLGLIPIVSPGSEDDEHGVRAFLEQLVEAASLEASGRVQRTKLLIRETDRLINYLGADRRLRVRASLGPLTVPPDASTDIFGDATVLETEAGLRDSVLRFLDDGGELHMIVNPVDDGVYARAKGYSREAHEVRLATFLGFIEQYLEQIRVAVLQRPSDANEWIAADRSLIESYKGTARDGRLYSYGRVSIDRSLIRLAIRRFDADFFSLTGSTGGMFASTRNYITAIERELSGSCRATNPGPDATATPTTDTPNTGNTGTSQMPY